LINYCEWISQWILPSCKEKEGAYIAVYKRLTLTMQGGKRPRKTSQGFIQRFLKLESGVTMKKSSSGIKKKHAVRNGIWIGLATLAAGFVIYLVITGIVGSMPKLDYSYGSVSDSLQVKYPPCRFAVISDTHYFDKSLWDDGAALQKYLAINSKLLEQSADILDYAVDTILKSNVQFVLLSGDITKDGEKLDHEMVAKALARLTARGIKVYVIPGNHDVLNPWAFSYRGSKTDSVPNVTAKEFADIYANCGYDTALYRDSGSLSYVAEPVQGLWLVCMDSCRYYDNKQYNAAVTAGKLTQSEVTWMEGILKKARSSGKAVMVMMHHGIMEHWNGQSRLYAPYVVEDYQHISKLLSSYGVKLVFSGHFHAQDIAEQKYGANNFIFDIETGALVAARCPVRVCTIDDAQVIHYETTDLDQKLFPTERFEGKTFAEYASEALRKATTQQQYSFLRTQKISTEDAKTLAGGFADAFLAHHYGDENPAQRAALDTGKLETWSRAVLLTDQPMLDSLWADPSVKNDNNGAINLATGKQN
jgi:3',5'-cyclic AMP phosphodiesterase CpdA